MRPIRSLALIAAAGSLLTSTASAQLMPPPPPGEEKPAYVPPVRPQPAAAPARPTQPAQPAQPRQSQPRSTRGEIPDMPYAPLACPIASVAACKDYEGPPAFYDRPLHIMALTRNPTTVTSTVGGTMQYLAKRRAEQLEPAILENLDLVIDIEDGLIETVGISDLRGLRDVSSRLQTLTAKPPLTTGLQEQRILTRVQAEWNLKVMSDYQKALGTYWQEAEPERANDLLLQHVMKDSVAEAMEAYHAMLSEVALRPDSIVAVVDLPPAVTQSFLNAKTDVSAFARERSRLEAVEKIRLAMRPLTIDQRRAVLQAVKDTRAGEGQSLITPFDVTYDGKQVVEVEEARIVTPENAAEAFQGGGRPEGAALRRKVQSDNDD